MTASHVMRILYCQVQHAHHVLLGNFLLEELKQFVKHVLPVALLVQEQQLHVYLAVLTSDSSEPPALSVHLVKLLTELVLALHAQTTA